MVVVVVVCVCVCVCVLERVRNKEREKEKTLPSGLSNCKLCGLLSNDAFILKVEEGCKEKRINSH